MSERIRLRERALGPSFDLLAAYDPADGFFMERTGFGIAAAGSAARIVVPAGSDQARRAAAAARARLAAFDPGTAPVALGVLPFAGTRDAVLTVPARLVRRDEAGSTEVTVGDPGSVERLEYERRGGDPSEPFDEMRIRAIPEPDAYLAGVARIAGIVQAGTLRKVVLARTIEVGTGRVLRPKQLVHRLRAVDPSCFAFAAASGSRSVLVGASPELLVSRRGSTVRSTPLAGSSPRSGDPEEDRANGEALRASDKNREEHAAVVDAVAQILGPACDRLVFDPEPVLLPTANVWHLATRFEGALREPAPTVLDLVADLHPTPAVGGSPRGPALDLIHELEPFDRGCYAGPVGWIDARGDGEWAVALRCAELRGDHATLYAGAGIVADSEPAAELDETERKFRAFLDALRWG